MIQGRHTNSTEPEETKEVITVPGATGGTSATTFTGAQRHKFRTNQQRGKPADPEEQNHEKLLQKNKQL